MSLEILLLKKENTDPYIAEAGTGTTTIKLTNHGMTTGSMILNATRNTISSPASRKVTVVDANTLELNRLIDFQTSGDSIFLFKYYDITSMLKARSFKVKNRAERRNECTFKLTADNASQLPVAGQQILVKHNGVVLFGGSIRTIATKVIGIPGQRKIEATISSDGYNHIPARRSITVDYPSLKTSGQIVTDMINLYLSAEGITAGTIQNGANWDEYPKDFPNKCISVKVVLDDMANASGYKWYIDNNRQLHFVSEDTVTNAAHTITDAAGATFTDFDDIDIRETLSNYRNKQFVKGGLDEIYSDVIVNYMELIDAIVDRQYIEGGSGVYGAIYEDTNIENIEEYTAETGTTTSNVTITGHARTTGDMMLNVTRNKKARITVTDANNFICEPSISLQASGDKIAFYPDGNSICRSNLKRYGMVVPKEISFNTGALDFVVGTKLTVNLAAFGMTANQYYLIEEVSIWDEDGKNLRSSVSATQRDGTEFSTQHTGDWIDAFTSMVGKGGSGLNQNIKVSVGASEPNNPKPNDIWFPTIDRTEYDLLSLNSNYTLQSAESGIIECDGTFMVTLPSATVEQKSMPFIFKNIGLGLITIYGAGTQTIDGNSYINLNANEAIKMYCDGSNWRIVSKYVPV